MQLAFYAPMKPPNHPVPSGDRSIARGLIAALRHSGADVDVPCTLRIRDGKGDAPTQHALIAAAQGEIDRLVALGRTAGWQAWITYHNYYKAPDLIGPVVSHSLQLPYVQIESTRARKRLSGAWSGFASAAEAATDAADIVFYFSARDATALQENAVPNQQLIHLRPFLPVDRLGPSGPHNGPMLSVGMMRAGDKLASYQIIADTLAQLTVPDWQLDIAGDGPARAQVQMMMARFGTKVRFLGQLDADALAAAYRNARLMLWPGVNEALGMVYLEAQAAGLPVIAQNRPGMCDLLAPAGYPDPADGALGLGTLLEKLLGSPAQAAKRGAMSREYVRQNHLLPRAAQTLRAGLAQVGVTS